jgi:hypothetical protein
MRTVAGDLTLSPSDLNDYVECAHLTTLALEVAKGGRVRPHVADEQTELLRRKGEEHERAHLERLRAEGRVIVEIELGEPWDFEAAAARTALAMRDGAEVIAQATFVDGRWRGRADFLLKVQRRTKLGAWGYEALDAKLVHGHLNDDEYAELQTFLAVNRRGGQGRSRFRRRAEGPLVSGGKREERRSPSDLLRADAQGADLAADPLLEGRSRQYPGPRAQGSERGNGR